MNRQEPPSWKQALKWGLLGGAVVLHLSLVGMVEAFTPRFIIAGIFNFSLVLISLPILLMAYLIARRITGTVSHKLLMGGLTGLAGGLILTLLLLIGQVANLRLMLINASPGLFETLSFKVPLPLGALMPLLLGLVVGVLGAGIYLLPELHRKALIQALTWVIFVGLLRDLITTVISRWGPVRLLFSWLFAFSGLTVVGAIFIFVVIYALTYWRLSRPAAVKIIRSPKQQKAIRYGAYGIGAVIILMLPTVLGIFFSEILDNVGLFILMGLGLNIVVGFAGLLDLGYVAFYAIGAYIMGVLTSPELASNPLTYWQALPFALIGSTLAGILLGLPVLRLRGDYLAIVTLGFGEIVRLLVLSDWLRPWLGGSQGIQKIAQPRIGNIVLDNQQDLYYLIVFGIAIAIFIATRLKDSHLGRTWMALREDEDVAQAMGINLVVAKLSAFAMGALFSGFSGTIFAAKLTSAYPHSFQFMVSINVLCLIIIGGMGSIPGVVIGALALVGLPDLLREFAEYRLLVYGAVLVAMMLLRPEGLLPEARRRLELHEEEAPEEIETASPAASTAD